jgi:hypothetical protein
MEMPIKTRVLEAVTKREGGCGDRLSNSRNTERRRAKERPQCPQTGCAPPVPDLNNFHPTHLGVLPESRSFFIRSHGKKTN